MQFTSISASCNCIPPVLTNEFTHYSWGRPNLIGLVKMPEKLSFPSDPPTSQVLDSLRRHTNGLYGFTLEHQAIALERLTNDTNFRNVASAVAHITQKKIQDDLPLRELRKIAKLLLEHGADSNAEHITRNIRGYTPLMLSAELNEGELLREMIGYDGDVNKTCRDLNTGLDVDCSRIAQHFNAKAVLAIIQQTQEALPQ